jgi:hypothetical protein
MGAAKLESWLVAGKGKKQTKEGCEKELACRRKTNGPPK